MERPPSEVVVGFLSFVLLWVLVVVGVLALAPRWERAARARDCLVAEWKPSPGTALLFLVSFSLGGRGANPLGAISVLCQSLVGLSPARGIVGYDAAAYHPPSLLAVLVSALAFGLYHLTPLDTMYRAFWEFPVSQVLASTLAGVVLGCVYVRRGFERVVLGHTLSNWIPLVIFTR